MQTVEEQLELLIEVAEKLNLPETQSNLEVVLEQYEKRKIIRKKLLDNTEKIFFKEASSKDLTYKNGLVRLKDVLLKMGEVKKKKGKKVNLFDDKYGRLENIESIKLINKELENHNLSQESSFLLKCLAFLIQYEVTVSSKGWHSTKLRELIQTAYPGILSKDRDLIIEEMITVKFTGTDDKSDTTHIRNAIAHGWMEISPDGESIEFTDYSGGKETFRAKLTKTDFHNFNAMFEKKVAMNLFTFWYLELYAHITNHSIKME